MLRRRAFNRIVFTSIIFFVVFVLYNLNVFTTSEVKQNNENRGIKETIYTLNNDNYVSQTEIYVGKVYTLEDRIREKLETMVKENNKNALLPSYFKPILPENTKVLAVKVEDSLVKVYFSKELENITEEQSEQMIEAIVYTIIDENILGVEIYVDGEMLRYVPHTKKELPTVLTKNFGINKTYSVFGYSDIKKVTMNYYLNNNDNYFIVPVTKYVNDDREVLEIIFDELLGINGNTKLISLLDDIGINSYEIKDKVIIVDVNKELSDKESNLLALSIFNNYDINKITFLVNGKKKYEKTLKDIEN